MPKRETVEQTNLPSVAGLQTGYFDIIYTPDMLNQLLKEKRKLSRNKRNPHICSRRRHSHGFPEWALVHSL